MKQPTDLEKEAVVSHILRSPEFHESKRYQELLQYLVAKSAKVDSLKETEIAQEVFGKDSKFDPSSDPLIRSYVSNLRKKLEHYYLTTDQRLNYKLEIPKGQYLVKFTPVTKSFRSTRARAYLPAAYLVIIAILVAVIVYLEVGHRVSAPAAVHATAINPIWNEFIGASSRPTLIVIGDYLVLTKKNESGRRTFLRDTQVNSERELRELARISPNQYVPYQIADVTYIAAGAAVGVGEVIKVLGGSSHVDVKLSSELKWDDFDNNNIIYIGTLKTLDKLDTLFSRTNLKIKLNPNRMEIIEPGTDSLITLNLAWLGGTYQKDYSIVLKVLGSKNNSILFLTGFSSVGIMESVKAATDPALLTRIEQFSSRKIIEDPLSFELISEVEGVRYTVFRSAIKFFSPLKHQTAK
jgi:hypothetical protein